MRIHATTRVTWQRYLFAPPIHANVSKLGANGKGNTYPTYNSPLQLLGQTFLSSIKPVFTFDRARLPILARRCLPPLSRLLPLPILLLLFFDRKKLDLSVNKNRTDICFAYFRRGVIEFENSETSASNRAEDTRDILLVTIFATVVGWARSRIHVPPYAFASKLLHSRIARVANFRNSERLLINYVSFFFFFTFRDCEMKLHSPTVNKFFLLRRWKSCTSGGISLYIFVVKK